MLQEELLYSWINASLLLKTNRFLNDASLYEMIILRLIEQDKNIKAVDICIKLNLLKSQVSHILNGMQKKGLITKKQDESDKRNFFLIITEKGISTYKNEHEEILSLMDNIQNKLGEKKSRDLCNLLQEVSNVIKEYKND